MICTDTAVHCEAKSSAHGDATQYASAPASWQYLCVIRQVAPVPACWLFWDISRRGLSLCQF